MQFEDAGTAGLTERHGSSGVATVADAVWSKQECGRGFLIINADDWGRDTATTDRTLECWQVGTVNSVSAMMWMEDSERAAQIAREKGVEAGLHLNFTTKFSSASCPGKLRAAQEAVGAYLLRNRIAQVIFHPGLMSSFEYVVRSQITEFARIYGDVPYRVDGHHHMHLCANVMLQGLLPKGAIVRRNFSFFPGEKSLANRAYRGAVDKFLSQRHRMTDYFFSLPPLTPEARLDRIFGLAKQSVVEVETHPIQDEEYRYLTGCKITEQLGETRRGVPSHLPHGQRSGMCIDSEGAG